MAKGEESMSGREATLRDYRRDHTIARGPVDIPFLVLTLLLLTIGVVMVLSASYASAYYDLSRETGGNASYYFGKQLVFAVLGVAAMLAASRFPMSFFRRISVWVLLTAIVLLVAVLVIGVGNSQATRWILVGPVTVQPSEIAKIGVILFFAHMVCVYNKDMETFKYGVLPFCVVLFVVLGLLAAQPHFSAIVIIAVIGAMIMFVGGMKAKWLLLAIGAGVGFLVLLSLLPGFSSSRIAIWRDPFSDPSDTGFQIVQSLYAVGSGGLFGLGLGQSRQKYLYLPEEHNDFIFAIVCEELGFIGALLILTLFALLIVRGFWIALHSRDRYSCLVVTGVTSLLALQVIFNVAVCTNLIPATGISLPFFSYGGSALLIQLGEMGIILSASRDIPVQKIVKKRKKQSQGT